MEEVKTLRSEQRDCLEVRLSFWKRTVSLHPPDMVAVTQGRFYILRFLEASSFTAFGNRGPPARAAGHSRVDCSLNQTLGRGASGDRRPAHAELAELSQANVHPEQAPFSNPHTGAPRAGVAVPPAQHAFSPAASSSSMGRGD